MRLTGLLVVLLFLGAALQSTGCYRVRRPAVAGHNSTDAASWVDETLTADGAPSTTDVARRTADERSLTGDDRTKEPTWEELWPRLRAQLRQDRLDDAQLTLAELKQAKVDLTAGQSAEMSEVEAELRVRKRVSDERSRDSMLDEAVAMIDRGELSGAASKLENVLSSGPTEEQQAEAARLKTIVDQRLTEYERLVAAIQALGDNDPDRVVDAQHPLFEDLTAALPLLREAARSDSPVLVRNALITLGKLRQPDTTLPIMLDVLRRPEADLNWADAIRQIEAAGAAGAGEALLELSLSAEDPRQRAAALDGLAKVSDPPQRTFVALLPKIHQDGPHLAATLTAAAHAVDLHRQHDVMARRGLAPESSREERQWLEGLGSRLLTIMAGNDAAVADAARRFGIVTRLVPAEPLPDVKVLAFGAEAKNGPAAAVVDGIWNTVTANQMWTHPQAQTGSLVLDLGCECTVAGVRIWNLNEPSGTHRGWKETTIYVGSSPTPLATPAATGIVPPAPGTANAPDYSTTIPVPFVCGRYVRLQADSVWRQDDHIGLTEVQVLGFRSPPAP